MGCFSNFTSQIFFLFRSEVLAAEVVTCLNKALYHLKDIWEEIGIPEDQRLQRTNVVKSHIKVGVHSLYTEGPIRHNSSPVSGEGGCSRAVSGWGESLFGRLDIKGRFFGSVNKVLFNCIITVLHF